MNSATLDDKQQQWALPKKQQRFKWSMAMQYTVLIVLAWISLLPIIIMVLTSFKTQVDIMSRDTIWVFAPTFDNYDYIFKNNFNLYLGNSIVVSLSSTFLSLGVSGMAAYALARLRFPGRGPIAYFTLLIRMVPPAVLAIPIFYPVAELGRMAFQHH